VGVYETISNWSRAKCINTSELGSLQDLLADTTAVMPSESQDPWPECWLKIVLRVRWLIATDMKFRLYLEPVCRSIGNHMLFSSTL